MSVWSSGNLSDSVSGPATLRSNHARSVLGAAFFALSIRFFMPYPRIVPLSPHTVLTSASAGRGSDDTLCRRTLLCCSSNSRAGSMESTRRRVSDTRQR